MLKIAKIPRGMKFNGNAHKFGVTNEFDIYVLGNKDEMNTNGDWDRNSEKFFFNQVKEVMSESSFSFSDAQIKFGEKRGFGK